MSYSWKDLTLEELNNNFNPRIAVPNFEKILKLEDNKDQKARNKIPCQLDLRYGTKPLQTLDIFANPNLKNAPVHIFIHGGYWRALDKNNHSHLSQPFVKYDIIYVSINYDLCPEISLDDIVKEIIDSIVWIYQNIKEYGGDPNNLNLSGHSAGAHLAAMLITIDWKKYNIDKKIFRSISLISGIYEPEIVLKLPINKEIQLTDKVAKNNNVLSRIPLIKDVLILVAVGSNEPVGWKNQSIKYYNFIKKYIENTEYFEIDNSIHFSMISLLANERSNITRKILDLIIQL